MYKNTFSLPLIYEQIKECASARWASARHCSVAPLLAWPSVCARSQCDRDFVCVSFYRPGGRYAVSVGRDVSLRCEGTEYKNNSYRSNVSWGPAASTKAVYRCCMLQYGFSDLYLYVGLRDYFSIIFICCIFRLFLYFGIIGLFIFSF